MFGSSGSGSDGDATVANLAQRRSLGRAMNEHIDVGRRPLGRGGDAEYAQMPRLVDTPTEIREAIAYQEDARVDEHPFFDYATSSAPALTLWAEQEYFTSATFSQVLALWVSTIDNFHIRTMVMPVLTGEHYVDVSDAARRCHPNLARNLCLSLGLDISSSTAIEPTLNFIDAMQASALSPLFGAGFLGVGNERMLVPEYGAVKACFVQCLPNADFRPFLDANIEDDKWHHALIERAATAMVSQGFNAADFVEGTKQGVDARLSYYDELLEFVQARTT